MRVPFFGGVPLGFRSSSAAVPTRGASLFPSAKSGLFPISSIEPPASLSASSRSSAACFITVFSLTGPVSGSLVEPGNIPAAAAVPAGLGGGTDAPIPMIVSLRISPGRSEPAVPGTAFGCSEFFGRSEICRVAAFTAASPASFSVA